jgi:hypothetical protein
MADDVVSIDEARNDETRAEPAWRLVLNVLRALAGGVSLVLGLLWLLLTTTQGKVHANDIVVGVVLTMAGLVLLMPHRIRLPRLVTAIAAAAAGVVGAVAGLAVKTAQYCCDYAYVVDRGWPFHWLERGAVADDADTAYRLAQTAGWDVNAVTLAADLVLWAYVGMLLVVIAVLVRRARGDHDVPDLEGNGKKAD